MKHIQNIISSITLALIAEGRRLGLLLMAVVMMTMTPTNAWADDEPATLVTNNNYTTLGLTSDHVGYYAIGNAGQLYWFAANAKDKSAVLTADIVVNQNVLKADLTLNSGNVENFRQWEPFVLSEDKTFDGNGHTISGLYCFIDRIATYSGLTRTNLGTIKNVGIKYSYFYNNANEAKAAGVCGDNVGTITNCYATNVMVDGSNGKAGGVCGYNAGTITNCYATSVKASSWYSGGVCGCNEKNITNCYTDYENPIGKNTNDGSHTPVVTHVETKSPTAFANGEVCYLLNGSVDSNGTWTAGTGTPTWYQNLSTDATPVLVKDGTSNTVYYGYNGDCYEHYYNNSNGPNNTQGAHEHVNGFCKRCDAYEPATAVTAENYSTLGFTTDNYTAYVGYYAIKNAGQLYWFAANAKDKSAVLTADIVVNQNVLKADLTLNSGNVENFRKWEPFILREGKTFDGNGHTISGLYCFIDHISDNSGLADNNFGTIKNVGIMYSYFYNNANEAAAAGVCAYNTGTITNCYAMNVMIDGYDDGAVAGVCGENAGTITNCYATNVKASGEHRGGVCGYNMRTITNCYTDYENPIGKNTNDGSLTPVVTHVETKSPTAFANGEVSYLLNGSVDSNGTWTAGTGTPTWYQNLSTDAAPVLVKDGTSNTVYYGYNGTCTKTYSNDSNITNNSQGNHEHVNGFCKWCDAYEPATAVTAENYSTLGFTTNNYSAYLGYYAIKNAGQLYWFAANAIGKSAVLTADIVVNQNVLKADLTLSDNSRTFRRWKLFELDEGKTFDGDNHTVSGLYYSGDGMRVGLVGKNIGTIKNVGVKDSYFFTSTLNSYYVGGVCGYNNNGTITNCYATNVASIGYDSGGVCGYNDRGTITNCYATNVKVIGTYPSGVCGKNESGTITNCYATNVSTPGDNAGGVCGHNYNGTISNCYATKVTAANGACGVCIYNEGTITNCYATSITGGNQSVGVCGLNYGTITNCYTDYNKTIGLYNGTSTQVEKKSAEAFASGEVCYLLNGSVDSNGIWTAGTGTPTWYQKIPTITSGQIGSDGDAAPVFVKDGTSNTVYAGYKGTCKIVYTNNNDGLSDTPNHQYENFTCKLCHDAPASLTTGTLQDKVAYLRTTGLTVADFTYTRQFEGTNWTTWYVPFNLTLTDDICAKYSFASINNVHQYDNDDDDVADHTVIECSLLSKGTTLKANYPYLVRARTDADKAMNITLQDVTLAEAETKSIDCQSVDEKYTFTGTYTSMGDGVNTSARYSLLDNEPNGWKLFSSLCPQRHYLTITSRSSNNTVIAATSIEPKVYGEESSSPGDLNSDGKITITDLAILIQLLNNGAIITSSAADMDNDGFVDMRDIELLKTRLLQVPAAP